MLISTESSKQPRRRMTPRKAIPLLLLSAGLLYVGWTLVRGGLVLAAGQANGCSYGQILPLRSVPFLWTWLRLSMSTQVAPVEGADLVTFETPVRKFYAPKGSAIEFVLAEQLTRVYGDGEYRVRKGDIVLDCGANMGTFVHEALSAGAKLVVAIEPSPGNVEAMKRTFAREIEQGRVIVYPKGVWHQDDVLEMMVYDNSALDTFVMAERREASGKKARKLQLPLTTIDKLVRELGLERVDYIKMDVEGAERKAIAGGAETIRKWRPRMSIATENLDDDYLKVPEAVKAVRADYTATCILCRNVQLLVTRPDILHFN